ncbi:hypothetical protein FOZ63_021337, partial [Perkinsus olseni]
MGDDVDNTIGNSIAYRGEVQLQWPSRGSPSWVPFRYDDLIVVPSATPSLPTRHGAWAMKREQRLEERRREKEEDSMRECKFKPRTTAQRRGTQTRIGPQQYGKVMCLRVLLFSKLFVVCLEWCVGGFE